MVINKLKKKKKNYPGGRRSSHKLSSLSMSSRNSTDGLKKIDTKVIMTLGGEIHMRKLKTKKFAFWVL